MKNEQNENFRKMSEEIVREFLHTVVAVDDNISFGINNDTYPTEEDVIVDPEDDTVVQYEVTTRQASKSKTKIRNHPFNYQDLAESFASSGIVCSGLLASNFNDDEKNNIIRSSSKADITILDWDMCNDGGFFASQIIESMLSADVNKGGRLRLLTIYTGENVQLVASSLNTFLKEKFDSELKCSDKIILKKYAVLKHWLITIVSKDVQEKNLPDILISHFTDLTSGLLSNAALACVSDLRSSTHKILSKYNNGLDTAYASHILSLIAAESSRDYAHEAAQTYAVDLISEEIRASLQISDSLKMVLSREAMKEWPSHHENANGRASFYINKPSRVAITSAGISDIFSASDSEKLKKSLEKNQISSKKTFYLSMGEELDSKLMNLCSLEFTRRSLKYHSNIHSVTLKQGSIIKDMHNNVFLCIQPLCDSVRLRDSCSFIFLKGSIDNENYNIIIDDRNGKYFKLKINPVSNNIERILFSVDNNKGMIVGTKREGSDGIFFPSPVSSEKDFGKTYGFEWLGELKSSFAQRMVGEVSHSLSRIGLDQHEWLRLQLKKTKLS